MAEKWAQDLGNSYPQAGAGAQPEIQSAIERFRSMSEAQRSQQPPLLYWLIGSPTQPYKMSKPDAAYGDKSPSLLKTCGNCQHAWQSVKSGFIICALVRGKIKAAGICKLWEA